MTYMGSKRRIVKHILPIMLQDAKSKGIMKWVEPFVGGGNVIDKVPPYFKRMGFDLNPHTIAALNGIKNNLDIMPPEISEDYYKAIKGTEPDTVNSLIRFGASFGGKFDGGFARGAKRDYWGETLRNAKKQSPLLQGVLLKVRSFEKLQFVNSLIYCDPPYRDTTGYATGAFDHERFYDWCRCMAEDNIVFVSEYDCPSDFELVWEGILAINLSPKVTKATYAREKLFRVKL